MIDSGLPYPTYDEKASSSSSSSSSGGDTLKLISPELELVEKPRTYRDNEDRFELSPPGLNIPLMALNDELILNDAKLSLLQHQLDLSEYYQDDYSSSLSSYIQPPQMLPNTHQSVLTSSKSNSSLSTYLDYGCSPSLEHSSSLQVSNNSASKARRAIFRNLNNDASISAANSFVDSHSTAAATATTAATVRNPLLANPFLFSRVSNSTSTPSNMKVAYGGFAAAATANTSAAAALAQTQANLMSLNRFKLADDDDEQIQEMASYKLERQVTSTNRLPTPFPRRNPLQLSNIEDNQVAFMRQSNLSKVEETNLSFRQQQFVYPYNNSYMKPNTKGGVNRSSGGVPAPLVQPPVAAMNPFSGPSLLGDPPQAVAAAMALSRQMNPSYHYSPYLRAPLHHQSQSFGQSPAFNNRSSNYTKGPRQSMSQSSYQATGVRAPRAPHAQANTPGRKKEQIVLHVTNLDYKISANEWIRILTGILEKSCKEPITLTVESKEDKNKPLVGVLHLSRKEDARTAISLLHHKKIGYKRLNVNVVSPNTSASPRSKIVALLKSESSKNEPISNNTNITNNEMPLSKFMELFEARYSHTISIAELFKQRDLVQIVERGQGGRSIRLLAKNYPVRLDSAGEMYALLNSPYCSLHCSSASLASLASFTPNVIVSLRGFKIAVHKLLNDHGGHMSLLSFVECYRQCICDDSLSNIGSKMTGGSAFEAHLYHLLIDNENGVPLEHILTCVKDVQIEHNEEKHCKYLRWEADKSKPQTAAAATNMDESSIYNDFIDYYNQTYESDNEEEDDDEPHRIGQFAREVVELLKGVSRSILLVAKFNDEFHKKYGRQFRVADYGHTNLMGLLEAIPHIVQIIDGEFEKRITLTHRVQVRRFSNDLLKVLKGHPSRQMFADELPAQFERQLGRSLDIRDYGVCYVEDMLAELPESAAVSRKELNGRTFLLVQRFEQTDDERLCTRRLELEIVDLLKHKPRFLVRFNKLIPTYHHHFGRQCRLGNYGFLKLIDLIDAMPHCVHIFTRDLVQFVQLRPEIQIDLISSNIVNIIEENGCMLRISMQRLEDVYISKYDRICYRDFGCETFYELIKMLPLANKFVDLTILPPNNLAKIFDFANMSNREHNGEKETGSFEVLLKVSSVNKHMLMQISRILLKKMLEDEEGRQSIRAKLNEARASNRCLLFGEIWAILNGMFGMSELNERSKSIVLGSLSEYFNFVGTTSQYHNQLRMDSIVIDFSNLFHFAKQLVGIFKAKGRDDLMLEELESNCLYLDCFLNAQQPNQKRMKRFPAQMFGYIDTYLLFTQGLSLMLVVKKFGEKRMCFLRREFWSQTFANTVSVSKSGFNLSNYANQTDVSKLPRAIQARANFLRN